MLFFKRQKSAPGSTGGRAASVPDADGQPAETSFGSAGAGASDTALSIRDLRDIGPMREGADHAVQKGEWLSFAAYKAAISAVQLSASEGDKFRAAGHAVLIEASSGPRLPFAFGPVFYDGEGNIIGWWTSFDHPESRDPFEVATVRVAPTGTASVRLGIRGAWDRSGSPSDSVVGFASLRMEKV